MVHYALKEHTSRALFHPGDVSNLSGVTGTLFAVSAPLLTVVHTARAMVFFNPAKMPVCPSVRNPCDCLPNSGLKKPRAALLRNDTDVSATRHVLVLIALCAFLPSRTLVTKCSDKNCTHWLFSIEESLLFFDVRERDVMP